LDGPFPESGAEAPGVYGQRDARSWCGVEGFHKKTSIFLLHTRFRGNGSNDHAQLKSENGFVKRNRKLVRI
jgi:hypothetical protein